MKHYGILCWNSVSIPLPRWSVFGECDLISKLSFVMTLVWPRVIAATFNIRKLIIMSYVIPYYTMPIELFIGCNPISICNSN